MLVEGSSKHSTAWTAGFWEQGGHSNFSPPELQTSILAHVLVADNDASSALLFPAHAMLGTVLQMQSSA